MQIITVSLKKAIFISIWPFLRSDVVITVTPIIVSSSSSTPVQKSPVPSFSPHFLAFTHHQLVHPFQLGHLPMDRSFLTSLLFAIGPNFSEGSIFTIFVIFPVTEFWKKHFSTFLVWSTVECI